MRTLTFIAVLLAITEVASAGVKENAVTFAQQWQFALARSVKELVKQGERDPKVIARRATQMTRTEEKKVREAGKAMGVNDKELDQSIERDRRDSLKVYIKDSIAGGKEQHSQLKEEQGLLVFLNTDKSVANHPQLLKWGFQFSTPENTKGRLGLPWVQSASELIEKLRKEPKTVEQNGIWVVTPDSGFSKKDQRLLNDLKEICKREGIFMFVQSDLVSSWKQLSP